MMDRWSRLYNARNEVNDKKLQLSIKLCTCDHYLTFTEMERGRVITLVVQISNLCPCVGSEILFEWGIRSKASGWNAELLIIQQY